MRSLIDTACPLPLTSVALRRVWGFVTEKADFGLPRTRTLPGGPGANA